MNTIDAWAKMLRSELARSGFKVDYIIKFANKTKTLPFALEYFPDGQFMQYAAGDTATKTIIFDKTSKIR